MQPSQRTATAMPIAISSLVLTSSVPGLSASRASAEKPRIGSAAPSRSLAMAALRSSIRSGKDWLTQDSCGSRKLARPAHDVGRAHRAGLARKLPALPEQYQRGDAADAEASAQRRLRLGIDLRQPDLRLQL